MTARAQALLDEYRAEQARRAVWLAAARERPFWAPRPRVADGELTEAEEELAAQAILEESDEL